MNVETLLVNACAAKLEQLTGRIATCLTKLTDDQIWARGNESENAVGNLVLHLIGNVRQRTTAALADQPDTRQRDTEFLTQGGIPAPELTAKLQATMQDATRIVRNLTADQLLKTYEIQGLPQNGVELLVNVTEHFGQHTGQIIYATKQLTGKDLDLTMPRKR